jgi:Uma2 family endonuclease
VKAAEFSATPVRDGILFPLSVEAYHVLGEAGLIPKNSELLYGLVYSKMSKSPIHAVLIARLMRALRSVGDSYWVRSEQPITCVDSEPEPDISVVRGTEEDYLSAHPCTAELVIEVCVTSHDYDRSKLSAYARAGVKECWFVLGPEKRVEIYREPNETEYSDRKVFASGDIVCETLPAFSVRLADLFKR